MYKNKLLISALILLVIPLISAAHQLPTDLRDDGDGLMLGAAKWAYNVTSGWFWTMLLAGFCIVLFIATSRYSSDRSFGYATTTGMLGSLFLVTLNLISWYIATIFILVGILGIVWMILRKEY